MEGEGDCHGGGTPPRNDSSFEGGRAEALPPTGNSKDIAVVAEKLLLQVDRLVDSPAALTAQALKHLSGVLKDIRDLQTLRQEPGGQSVTVVLEGAVDGYGK